MTRALIVDDNEENLYYLDALLQGHGFTVEVARHGAEALAKARQNRPDLIIADLLMPVMDGYTLLRHWKAEARFKQVPFIVYTATYTEVEDERLALSLGADAFILKPAEPEDFLARIAEVQAAEVKAAPPRSATGVDEEKLLESYSATLIRKLEEKTLQLGETNQALQRDIVERKRVEEKLLQSEEAQRQLLETQTAILNALPAHIALVRSDGVIASVNQSWRRFATANALGSPGYGVGQNYLDVCERAHGDCSAEGRTVAEALRRVLCGELKEYAIEYPCHSPTEQRWFRLMVTPLHEDHTTGAVVMHLDITARKLTEERLQKLNRTYAVLNDINELIVRQREPQAILDGACRIAVEKGNFRMAWIGMLDAAGHELKPVAASGAQDGYPDLVRIDLRDETRLTGPTAHCLLRGEHSICSDIESDALYQPWRDEALRRGFRSSGAFPLRIDGRVVGALNLYASEPGFFTAKELDLLDQLATDIGFALEVSQRGAERQRALEQLRESEERFRELAETVQEIFWITDPAKNRMLYVSPAYEKIWGRTCASLYENPRAWLEAIHPDDRARVGHAALTKQMRGDYDETYRILRPDGTTRWIRDRAFPVRGASGEVLRIVGTAEDITHRRQLEEQFRQAQKMEALGTLAGGIAHDFNTILGAILGNVELARQDVGAGGPAMESLDEIRKAGHRAKELVERILAFGRPQQGPQRLIPLRPVVEEALALLRATCPKDVEVVAAFAADTPTVLADATQIHQVLINLCANAWQAMAGRGGRLDIRLDGVTVDAQAARDAPALWPGRFARLSVTDNGSGMDEPTLERIFDPFFTTKPVGEGTGLGLSVVHGIVKAHGGAITVDSEPDRGTTFTLYFPAVNAPQRNPQRDVLELDLAAAGRHVLYLDDDESLVFLTTRMLQRLGYRVSGYTRTAEALAAVRSEPTQFDLVVADLNLSEMSGLEVARALARLAPALPVVLASGTVTDELRAAADEAGVLALIDKPATVEDLCDAVRKLAAGVKRK